MRMPDDGTTQAEAPASGAEANDVAALQAENVSLRDRMMRALADTENTRRRAERTAQEARQFANTDFAREVLAVADNLRRALEAAEQQASDNPVDAALIEGVRATQRILDGILDRFGVRRIEAQGAPFDPALHEAMMELDDASHESGTVARVMEDGYTMHDRLLRPARVAVTARRADEQQPPDRAGSRGSNVYVANDHP
jgi:molecular chaperone GrpE